ncbi:MAG: hypothetical protein CVU48_09260 [Candidatus Cloacimonetes bacterium HGW-Cloacimonetes-1]|jgi:hypothetical protein|nr:MAG: hypothetical protein CVU48_09260 [Candidatus Cloacimonetes bacterium HGW-Cloacimonetes-1]
MFLSITEELHCSIMSNKKCKSGKHRVERSQQIAMDKAFLLQKMEPSGWQIFVSALFDPS